jgi:CheY-like chemotaxis protein
MDGLAIARDLRSSPLFQKITLVALTGYGQPDDRRRTLEAGFNHHLIKPVPMEELNKLLDLFDAAEQIVVD